MQFAAAAMRPYGPYKMTKELMREDIVVIVGRTFPKDHFRNQEVPRTEKEM